MLALATEDETLPWLKTRVGGFDSDDHPDFRGSAHSSWVYAEENGVGFSRNASDHIVQLEPVAELDGAGNVVARFVYATKGHSPDYVIKDGSTYRILSDHLGSPRLVIDVDSGVVVQRMDFDEWGVVTLDTSPGWQPFGFAGGLLDADTGLTRFGARDYSAAEGRWTAKDATVFDDGLNVFGYAQNDPINFIDDNGMQARAPARSPARNPGRAPSRAPVRNPGGAPAPGPGPWVPDPMGDPLQVPPAEEPWAPPSPACLKAPGTYCAPEDFKPFIPDVCSAGDEPTKDPPKEEPKKEPQKTCQEEYQECLVDCLTAPDWASCIAECARQKMRCFGRGTGG